MNVFIRSIEVLFFEESTVRPVFGNIRQKVVKITQITIYLRLIQTREQSAHCIGRIDRLLTLNIPRVPIG